MLYTIYILNVSSFYGIDANYNGSRLKKTRLVIGLF